MEKKNIAWFPEIRLDTISSVQLLQLSSRLKKANAAAVVFAGNVSQQDLPVNDLQMLEMYTGIPIYYVLGVNDFEGKSIKLAKDNAKSISTKNISWLNNKVVKLTDESCLIGSNCLGDGQLGKKEDTKFFLGSYCKIKDFKELTSKDIISGLQKYANKTVKATEKVLLKALGTYKHVVLTTPVPVFAENTVKDGSEMNEHMLAFCVCKTLGDMLIDVMSKHKDNKLTVISGFVKTNTTYSPSDNIVSITGLNHDVLDKVQNIVEVN
jgi:hypothetical protein